MPKRKYRVYWLERRFLDVDADDEEQIIVLNLSQKAKPEMLTKIIKHTLSPAPIERALRRPRLRADISISLRDNWYGTARLRVSPQSTRRLSADAYRRKGDRENVHGPGMYQIHSFRVCGVAWDYSN